MNNRVYSFVKNLIIFVLGSFGAKFLTFILLPVYTSILTTSQYGQIDIITTTQSLLFPIVSLGLSEAIFRFVMKKDIENKCVISNGITIISLTYFITVIVAMVFNIFLKWKYMLWMLLLLGCSMIYDILSSYLKAKNNSKKYVLIGILYTFISLMSNIVFLVVLDWKIKGYLLSSVVACISCAFFIIVSEKIYLQVRVKYCDLMLGRRMLKYSLPLIFTSLSWWIVTSSDKYMIRYFIDNSAVGIYSIASKIPLILQTLISILQTVWQISTNQIHDEEPEELKDNFVLFTRFFREVGFVFGSLLIICTQLLMLILAKKEFYQGWVYAPFLILSIIFSFATGMVSSLYGAYEQNSGVLYSVLLGGGINIALNSILIPKMGIMGATISTAISRLIIAIYRLKDTEKLLEFDREYGKVAMNCIMLTIQCCLLIYLDRFVYVFQFAFYAIICFYNRELFSKVFLYAKSVLEERVNGKN